MNSKPNLQDHIQEELDQFDRDFTSIFHLWMTGDGLELDYKNDGSATHDLRPRMHAWLIEHDKRIVAQAFADTRVEERTKVSEVPTEPLYAFNAALKLTKEKQDAYIK